jgi:hypothetical protein
MTEHHDEFTDVLGAYALDAVDPLERELIEDHLRTCAFCATEVREHREIAALLGQTAAPAPEGVWDRIAAELSPAAPPMRLSLEPASEVADAADADAPAAAPDATDEHRAPVMPIASARRSIRMRTFVAVVSAAALVIAVLGVVAVDRGRGSDGTQVATPGTAAIDVALKGGGGRTAQALVGSDGQGWLFAGDLKPPPEGDVYQLWGQVDGTVLSLGTFGDGAKTVPFHLDPEQLDDVEAFAVTQERSPGVVASDQDPVVVGETA